MHNNSGAARHCPRNPDALLHSPGKLLGEGVLVASPVRPFESSGDARRPPRPGEAEPRRAISTFCLTVSHGKRPKF